MKKISCLLLIVCLIATLYGCGSGSSKSEPSKYVGVWNAQVSYRDEYENMYIQARLELEEDGTGCIFKGTKINDYGDKLKGIDIARAITWTDLGNDRLKVYIVPDKKSIIFSYTKKEKAETLTSTSIKSSSPMMLTKQ